MYDLQIGAIFYSRLLKKNVAVEIIPKGDKVERRGLTFEDLQTVYSRLGNERLIAILAQPPSSSPTTAILTSDHHGSNFSHNSQVHRRKHPVLGIKLNPLSLLFQLARYHRNNTNEQLQNNGFRTLQRNHMFSVALGILLIRPRTTHVFWIFVTSTQFINREFLAFPSVNFFKTRLSS